MLDQAQNQIHNSPIANESVNVQFPTGDVVSFPNETTAMQYSPMVHQQLIAQSATQAQNQSEESQAQNKISILTHNPSDPVHFQMTNKTGKPVDVQYRPDQIHHVTLMGEHKTPSGGATVLESTEPGEHPAVTHRILPAGEGSPGAMSVAPEPARPAAPAAKIPTSGLPESALTTPAVTPALAPTDLEPMLGKHFDITQTVDESGNIRKITRQPADQIRDLPTGTRPAVSFGDVVISPRGTIPDIGAVTGAYEAATSAPGASVQDILASLKKTLSEPVKPVEPTQPAQPAAPPEQVTRWRDLPMASLPTAAPSMHELAAQGHTYEKELQDKKAGDKVPMLSPNKDEVKLVPVEAVQELEKHDFQLAKPIRTERGDTQWASYAPVILPQSQAPQVVPQRKRSESTADKLARIERLLQDMKKNRFKFGTRQFEPEEEQEQ